MRRHFWLATLGLAAGMGPLVQAQSSAPSPPQQLSQPGPTADLHAKRDWPAVFTVKKVDRLHHTLTLEVPMAPGAEVEQNGHPIGLNQLQEGDQVRAAFDAHTGAVLRVDKLPQTGQQKPTNLQDGQNPMP